MNREQMTEKARQVFARDRYACSTTGIEIVEVEEHKAMCRLEVSDSVCNANGVVMGGALCTLGDFASAIAANTDYLEERLCPFVSVDATIQYLAAAKGERLTAVATALKKGRRVAVYRTEIYSGEVLIAQMTSTMIKSN